MVRGGWGCIAGAGDFGIGLLVGDSASGKSVFLNHFFQKPEAITWRHDDAVIAHFESPDAASARLMSVGLNAVPTWLKPFTMTYLDPAGGLHIATKGFVINFTDPRYQKFPDSWRGTHYCHLVAPEYMERLLSGEAAAGAVIGREPDRLRMPSE